MDMNSSNLVLMTLFNAAVCILLPRLLTLDWAQFIQKAFKQIETTEDMHSEVSG